MRWDVFCRVVDNYGDIGVAWRLAADLSSRGERVRLFVDDGRALAWMAPEGAAGVEVHAWSDAEREEPAEVVLEAFACGVPDAYGVRMRRAGPPVWVNLEYLTAEAYAERSHGLPSPRQHGPCAGLVQWFFFPGFTPATGGVLREQDLLERQRRFDGDAWLRAQAFDRPGSRRTEWKGATPAQGADDGPAPGDSPAAALARERRISLFCYANERLDALVDALASRPTVVFAAAGRPLLQMTALLGPGLRRGGLRAVALPRLTQVDYDRLLWACDLNIVRGEDSFVRAQWAGVPFLWQAYPQDEGVHARKVDAFLDLFIGASDGDEATAAMRGWFRSWNGAEPCPAHWPDERRWTTACVEWRTKLLSQTDLTTRLLSFVGERR